MGIRHETNIEILENLVKLTGKYKFTPEELRTVFMNEPFNRRMLIYNFYARNFIKYFIDSVKFMNLGTFFQQEGELVLDRGNPKIKQWLLEFEISKISKEEQKTEEKPKTEEQKIDEINKDLIH